MSIPDPKPPETRIEVRVWAGFLTALCLVLGVPVMTMLAIAGRWECWIWALGLLWNGIGFLGLARTGRWFRFRKSSSL